MGLSQKPVAIIMGSQSDWATMRHASDLLTTFGVAHDTRIVSAHRTPDRLYNFAKAAKDSGFKVIIAGAGGAAHLPGMTAAMTSLSAPHDRFGGRRFGLVGSIFVRTPRGMARRTNGFGFRPASRCERRACLSPGMSSAFWEADNSPE